MLLALLFALSQQALRPTGEVVLSEVACVPLQAPHRKEGSISNGAVPDPDSLHLPISVTILRSGRVLVSDLWDGTVHIFDESGERVALCVLPELRSRRPLHLTGDRRDHVLLEAGIHPRPEKPFEYEFAADGTFLGQRPLARSADGSLAEFRRYFSPIEDAKWTWRTDRSMAFIRAGMERRAWPQRPDGGAWRLGGGGFLDDGRFVVLDRYVPPVPSCFGHPRSPPPDLHQILFVFDPEGECLEQIDLPAQPPIHWIATGSRRALLDAPDDEWFLLDLDSRCMTSARLAPRADTLPDERETWNMVVRPDGTEELWVVQRKARRLIRYALPE